jgi:REP element-mobilizing transposase RayT
MVIAYHLIWTAYGWWLPNDPRGSGSETVHSNVLAELGEVHHGRKKIQPAGRIVRAFYEKAALLLRHPLLKFDERARSEIAAAFESEIANQTYTCWACAVMPDHVHILIRKHKQLAEEMTENLMHVSRLRLIGTGYRESDHPTWTAGTGWKVFLDHPDDVRRTIRYIEQNPVKIRLPQQHWPFVKPYDGWPLHKAKPQARR